MKTALLKILAIARNAAELLMKRRARKFQVSIKNKDQFNFVTSVDKDVEMYILRQLHAEFPKYLVLSEETSQTIRNYHGFTFMVDPLDGTKDFVHGGNGFAVMIGLCKNGKPHIGVVVAPMRKITYYAVKGFGAFVLEKGAVRRMYVSKTKNIANARHVVRVPHGEKRATDELLCFVPMHQRIPEVSVGLKLGLIARGLAEVNINTNLRACKWDTCAPQIILEEAGGKITDWLGKPLDYTKKTNQWEQSFVATNGYMHKDVLLMLEKAGVKKFLSPPKSRNVKQHCRKN